MSVSKEIVKNKNEENAFYFLKKQNMLINITQYYKLAISYKLLNIALLAISVFIIFKITNVDSNITDGDILAFDSLGLSHVCNQHDTFDMELNCITELSKTLQDRYNNICITDNRLVLEPEFFIKSEENGCCFDRSRFIEKFLEYYGFKIRHVSLYVFKSNLPWSFLDKAIISHAASEVLTRKGWMYLGSLNNFIALDNNENPLTIHRYKKIIRSKENNLVENQNLDLFVKNDNFWAIYGLYSRSGNFYPPAIPLLPKFSWSQLVYNLHHD
ncbi:MAG: hypothetical protein H7833_06645 [Magnetococcus sp. DMHC-1]|nr:hypothetical protein [Magnetococcales bacterium]